MREIMPEKLKAIRKEYIWGTEDWMLSGLHAGMEDTSLLVKMIHARENLSVQVHPGNDYAMEHENTNGKTEMWYVLDCEPGAFLFYGLKHTISVEEFRKRVKDDTILEICQKVPVKKGDVFFIPAGLVHAIGKGITVAEIQQNSNITYRIYDYHRKDEKKEARPLHIKQAGDVMALTPPQQGHRPMGPRIWKNGYYKTLLVRCPYFQVTRIEIETRWMESAVTKDHSLLILEGRGSLQYKDKVLDLVEGDSIFIRKGMGEYIVQGKLQLLCSEA